jgi:CRP/FNR family cyclic AMP-dependent transcriptional regulator
MTVRTILDCCDNAMPERRFQAGETLLKENHTAGILYILAEGSVEVSKGGVVISRIDSPGSLFGEISVLLETPHTATVKAVTDSRFYMADNPLDFLKSRPEIAVEVSKLLAERLNSMTTYLVDLKTQFEDQDDHLGMVDEVLETLAHSQRQTHRPGSDRDPDPNVY